MLLIRSATSRAQYKLTSSFVCITVTTCRLSNEHSTHLILRFKACWSPISTAVISARNALPGPALRKIPDTQSAATSQRTVAHPIRFSSRFQLPSVAIRTAAYEIIGPKFVLKLDSWGWCSNALYHKLMSLGTLCMTWLSVQWCSPKTLWFLHRHVHHSTTMPETLF